MLTQTSRSLALHASVPLLARAMRIPSPLFPASVPILLTHKHSHHLYLLLCTSRLPGALPPTRSHNAQLTSNYLGSPTARLFYALALLRSHVPFTSV